MTKRRRMAGVAVLTVLAVVGAACSKKSGGSGSTPPAAGPLGAVTIKAGGSLEIAVIESISGDTASLGTDQVRGVQIAVDDKGGKLLGFPIKLDGPFDDKCAADGGTASAQQVVANKQIVGVIGTSCSGAAVPAMQILSPAGYTMISGSNTSPFLTTADEKTPGNAHQPGYFRTAHNDIFQGAAAANAAFNQLGVTKAATINDGDPYTVGLAGAFNDSFTKAGGTIVDATAVAKDQTDMHSVLTEIASKGAQLIYFPIFEPAADFIVKQAKDVSGLSNTALMGADGLLSDTYMKVPEVHDAPPAPKGTSRGMYFSGPTVPASGAYSAFVQKYTTKFGEAPIQAFHAHAYDAANMLFAAIEKVAVKLSDGSLFIDRQKLRDAVGATKDFQGLTGTLSCDQFGDCGAPRIAVFQATASTPDLASVKANVIVPPPGS